MKQNEKPTPKGRNVENVTRTRTKSKTNDGGE